jgi:hypothetical protein
MLVSAVTPAIATNLDHNNITVGGTVTDTAELLSPTLPLDGTATVTYVVYTSVDACEADSTAFLASATAPSQGTTVATVTVASDGTVPSASNTFTTAGLFFWAAFFSGDANNAPAVSDCTTEPVQVTAAVVPSPPAVTVPVTG